MTGDDDLAFLSATRLAAMVRERKASPVELVRIYLARIARLDGRLRAYITVLHDAALDGARRAEAAVMRGGALPPLHGVPYAVKDQFDTAGVLTTVGSRLLEANVPIGLQLIARPFDEATLLRAAHAFEQQSEWSTRRPPDAA